MIGMFITDVVAIILATICVVITFLYYSGKYEFKSQVAGSAILAGFMIFPLVAGILAGKILTHL